MASSAGVRDDGDIRTSSDAPMAPQNGASADDVNHMTAAVDGGSAASQKATEALPTALAALNSAWSGWMGGGNDGQNKETQQVRDAQDAQDAEDAGNTAQSSADWFGGANRLWQTAVRDVGTRLRDAAQQVQQVDGNTLEQSVTLLRKQSGRVVEDVQRGVRNIQLGELVEHATTTLRQHGEEAKQMFVDETPQSAPNVLAPWDNLPQAEAMYGDALQREMLRLAVDSVYSRRRREQLFVEVQLPNGGDDGGGGSDGEAPQRRANEAMGALRAHSSLRRLRAMLVPAHVSETHFWAAYFFHVQRVRAELVANDGELRGGDRDGVDSHGDGDSATHDVAHAAAVEDVEDATDAADAAAAADVVDEAERVEGGGVTHEHDALDEDDEEFLSWRRGK